MKQLVSLTIRICGVERAVSLEYAWLQPARREAPLLVFLHEGLGSIALWKDWPARLCAATGCRGLVFSRYGYGGSSARPAQENWPPDFLQEQAAALPALFDALGVDVVRAPPLLFGHSDGATIALLYAALFPHASAAIMVEAPHVFLEEISVAQIRRACEAYAAGPLRDNLQRYHECPDSAFWGWAKAWLNPAMSTWNIEALLARITCPVLAIQGDGDEYGTLAQLDRIKRQVPQTKLAILDNCGHSPHVARADAVLQTVQEFLAQLPPRPVSGAGA